MAVRNIKLTIVYDGSEYYGWQIQPGLRTIQGVLTDAIQDLINAEVRLFGASRTDAGVSALGQVGLVQIDSAIPTENLARAITDKLPPDIAVAEAVQVADGFDLMGAVKSKLYRYTIFTGRVRPVLEIRHCWHLPAKLDITAMAEAAKLLVGKKDFKSFASAADKREDTVRTIFRCDVTRGQDSENDWIYVDVEGDGFLYNMVRNIVGTLVEVGVGRWKPEKINEILEAKDRTAAGRLAPAQGLCLMWIKYA
ncbi:MAG: tRNA pseudouridine(38-40) synthase TruA [Planctomycetota bacterium]|jgi:tRNA pseudouridine38-40 synthase